MKRRAGAVLACVTMSVFFVDAAWAAPTRYEAENAPATCDGTIDSNNAGFSGTGFCNTNNAVGAAAQLTVSASAAGTATIGIRYANGGTVDRPADILVNGNNVQPGGSFGPTGSAPGSWRRMDFMVDMVMRGSLLRAARRARQSRSPLRGSRLRQARRHNAAVASPRPHTLRRTDPAPPKEVPAGAVGPRRPARL